MLVLQALSEPCQALYLRLYQRVGPWFRIATLEYSEVPDSAEAVGQLAQAGFAITLNGGDPASLLSLAEVGSHMTTACLSGVCAASGCSCVARQFSTKPHDACPLCVLALAKNAGMGRSSSLHSLCRQAATLSLLAGLCCGLAPTSLRPQSSNFEVGLPNA